MKTYIGKRFSEGCEVYVVEDGKQRPLSPHHEIRNHSPDGFEWGYAGSGPAQLALAILADYCGSVKPPTVCPYCNSAMNGWKCTASKSDCGYNGDRYPEDKWDNIQNGSGHHYQNFKFDVITRLPKQGFELTGAQIEQWLAQTQQPA